MTMPIRSLWLLALCAPSLEAQTITLAEGTTTSLQIVTLPESNPNAPDTVVLQGVEFLPIEISGRTLAQEFDPTRSRRLVRHDITRVELPGGGHLFRYKRSSGAFWGFLHVAADGQARVVLERPGTGAAQNVDPFADRIAVAPDGLHAAVAVAAGGLYVVRLDGGTFASTGRADRLAAATNIDVLPTSVMAGPSTMYYQSSLGGGNEALWRCGLADGSVPVVITPPWALNAFLKDQMVLSRDGSVLVFLYGPQNQQRLWRAGTTGAATVLPPPASKYEEPGYLPEDPGEPAMLLSENGARLFYIDADVSDELYLLDLQTALPALQITADPIFQPYIGVHILPKFVADVLTVAIGDPNQMDWFRVALAPLGGTVVNLTGTGSMLQPYPAGGLDPVQTLDAGAYLLSTEQQAGGLALRRLHLATGAHALVQQNLLSPPQPGSTTGGVADIVVHGVSADSLYLGATGAPLVTLPPGVFLTPTVHGPQFAATWVHLGNGWGVGAFYLPDGTLAMGGLEFDLRQLAMTAAGGVVAIGSPVRYLAPGVFVVMNRPAAALRLCLSGAGG
ncbi:MAG: hypothetical protein ABIP94_08685 [Planctomycetota bacterium]